VAATPCSPVDGRPNGVSPGEGAAARHCSAESFSFRATAGQTVKVIGDGRMRRDDMAIIDSLMNLPLLHWAGNETGDAKF